MTKGQRGLVKQRKRRKARPHQTSALAAHRAFAPLLGVWGAALAGLPIMVLPAQMFAQASKGTGLALLLGSMAQAVLAGLAAAVLGGMLYIIAHTMSRKARRRADTPSIVALAARRVRTIDPRRDLGSVSLDEPVNAMPFAAAASQQPAPQSRAPDAPQPAADMAPPRALNLAEFAVLPGRNGVWVEDAPMQPMAATPPPPAAAPPLRLASKDDRRAAPPPHPSAAALARLRATPPEQLSIVQMVERFAAALHEHREAAPGAAGTPRDIAAREAALAEALRALAALSEAHTAAGPAAAADPVPGEPLRDALTRLQGLRGAA